MPDDEAGGALSLTPVLRCIRVIDLVLGIFLYTSDTKIFTARAKTILTKKHQMKYKNLKLKYRKQPVLKKKIYKKVGPQQVSTLTSASYIN